MRRALYPVLLLSAVLAAVPVAAQPYGAWIIIDRDDLGYINVPHDNAFNPGSEMTIEAWVNIDTRGDCVSVAGKGWMSSYWLGVCNTTVRTYVRGTASSRDGGTIPLNRWTHIAMTYDGAERRHYVNGILAAQWAESGAIPSNNNPFQVARDPNWATPPDGTLDEVRLWNRALSIDEIRANINQEFTTPRPSLIAVYGMNGADDSLGNYDGTLEGNTAFLTFPVTTGCLTTNEVLCLQNRFSTTISWRRNTGESGTGKVVPFQTVESGLFWFFGPNNWEVMVKAIDACGPENRFWIFSAAVTNVFYRMEVFDIVGGANKIYFNYAGPPAPAVTDTNAFATCP
ncbi:MAG: LamG domain-containing protein [Acidobacteriota bacterium]